eukprot:scaffold329359_cov54-Tisochrysis_lutea.AAC.2
MHASPPVHTKLGHGGKRARLLYRVSPPPSAIPLLVLACRDAPLRAVDRRNRVARIPASYIVALLPATHHAALCQGAGQGPRTLPELCTRSILA